MVPTVRIATRCAILCCMTLCIVSSGCTQQARRVEPSGFLGDYSQLVEGEADEPLLVYRNPRGRISDFGRVFVEPIVVWRSVDLEDSALSEEDAQALAGYLHKSLLSKLGDDYRIVTEPGPGAITIRCAITQAAKSHVVCDGLTTIVPPTQLLSTGTRFVGGTGELLGSATIEGEILDDKGKRLIAAVDRRYGASGLGASFSTWDDVETAFEYWGEQLRDNLRKQRSREAESR